MANSVPVTQQQALAISGAFSGNPYPSNTSPAVGFTLSNSHRSAILASSSNATLAVDYGYDSSTNSFIQICFAADNTTGQECSGTIYVTSSGTINASAAASLRTAYAGNPDQDTPSGQTGNVFERSDIASFSGDCSIQPGRDEDEALTCLITGAAPPGTVYINRPRPRPFS